MDIESFIKLYRFGFGFLILIAIVIQFLTFRQKPINFFSYFTILSCLFAAFVFIISALNLINQESIDMFRGAATLYAITTGLGFVILLGGKNKEFINWINIVLHYLAPTILLIDWVLTPSLKVPFEKAVVWIIPMLIYFIYSLARGAITSWYPYSFLDHTIVGTKGIAIYSSVLVIVVLTTTWILTKIGNLFSMHP